MIEASISVDDAILKDCDESALIPRQQFGKMPEKEELSPSDFLGGRFVICGMVVHKVDGREWRDSPSDELPVHDRRGF